MLRIALAGSLAVAGILATAPLMASPAVRMGAAVGQAPGSAVLVGSSGQLYHPVGPSASAGPSAPAEPSQPAGQPGIWQRRHGGGVAAHVVGVVYAPAAQAAPSADRSAAKAVPLAGELFAAGRQTPLYRFQDGAWHVHPTAYRGAVMMPGAGSAPVLAVGRHILVWRNNAFRRQGTATGPVTALFATNTAIYVATAGGGLDILRSGASTSVRLPLAAGDAIAQLAAHRDHVYGISQSGAIVRIRARTATLVSRDPALAGLVVHAAGVAANGTLWVAGIAPVEPVASSAGNLPGAAAIAPPGAATPAAATTPMSRADAAEAPGRLIIARTRDSGLALDTSFEPLTPGDRPIAVIAGSTDDLLVVTAAGVVHYRESGASWQNGTIMTDLPPSSASRTGPGPAPAR